MADSNIISWTPANWITVVLMVALAYLLVGAGARIWQQRQQSKGQS